MNNSGQNSNVVGAFDAKTRFSELLEQVESGREFTITKHGAPIARLVPIERKPSVAERRQAIERIQKLSRGLSLGGLKIRDLINEGRP
jgi:prevent-host-death family protein